MFPDVPLCSNLILPLFGIGITHVCAAFHTDDAVVLLLPSEFQTHSSPDFSGAYHLGTLHRHFALRAHRASTTNVRTVSVYS